MKEQRHRILCAVCALALVLTAVLAPAAWAADGAGEVQDTAKSTLTTDDAAEMQQADAAVTALTGSDEYEQMSREERLTSALRSWMNWPGRGWCAGTPSAPTRKTG